MRVIEENAVGKAGRPRPAAWPLRSDFGPVGALLTAPRAARAFTLVALEGWGFGRASEVTDASVAVVSELCNNVAEAAADARGQPAGAQHGHRSQLLVRLFSDRLRVRVEAWDDLPPAAGVPVPRRPGPGEEGGRGLLLVAELSCAWGWQPVPESRLKYVWALLSASPP